MVGPDSPAGSEVLALLGRLLRGAPAPVTAAGVEDWWRACGERDPELTEPIDRAIALGALADRVGFAFAAGYQAALRALVGPLPPGTIAAFCATERRGNHPRAIEARVERSATGGLALHGEKRWSTMGPLASLLLVVVSEGLDAGGRPRLGVVRVDRAEPGVTMSPTPPTSFVPEVPHAEIVFHGVPLADDARLPGDGYTRYLRRFRTVEDLHIHGAVLGYLLSAARRQGLPPEIAERLAVALVATRTLALLEADAPEVHVALAGLLAQDARLLEDVTAAWASAAPDDPERAGWERDRSLLGVARQAREQRRLRAWERLGAGPAGPERP